MTTTVEKDHYPTAGPNGTAATNGRDYDLGPAETHESTLHRVRTAGSISISPELFEKLYLTPEARVHGDLRRTFGNPTPLALLGFLLSLTPLSCDLMGWRGAGGSGAASVGVFFFMGGLLMILGSIFEFIIGNTFPFVVFGSFGGFWLAFAATLTPSFNAAGAYSPTGDNGLLGQKTQGFNASFGFFLVFMGVLCFIYMICSLRTNIAFFIIFFTLVCGFSCVSAAYFDLATGSASNLTKAPKLLKAAGAFFFVTSMSGWWIFIAQMLAALEFPFNVPVGDLSGLVPAAGTRREKRSKGQRAKNTGAEGEV